MRIGFIGLGDQGGPMAEMMLSAGHDVAVWARRSSVAERFAAVGAKISGSAAELASTVDLLGVCVTADADVREVLWERGALGAMHSGSVLSIHSTVRPGLCLAAAEAGAHGGVHVLDAPVSGSGVAARERRLLMLVGGDPAVLSSVRPAFEAYANPIVHQGEVGAGMRAKLLNNILSAAHLGLAAWALQSAKTMAVSPIELRRAVLAGTGRSFGMEAVERLSEPNRARHIGALVEKDVELAVSELGESAPAEVVALARRAVAALHEWADGCARPLEAQTP